MELLLYILGGLALALGSGVVFLALLGLEEDEPEGSVSRGWTKQNRKESDGRTSCRFNS